MDAGAVALRLLFVAMGAGRRLDRYAIVRMFVGNVRVAVGTCVRFVNGSRQLSLIHKERDFLSRGIRAGQ